MGDKNTISLLTSINGYLKTIVDDTNKNDKVKKEDTQKKMTQSLSAGPVLSGDTVKPKQEKSKVGDIFLPAETIAALNSLPVIILGIAKLKKKDIKNFTSALQQIKEAIDNLGKIKYTQKDAQIIKLVVESMALLEKTNFAKVALNLRLASILGFNKLLTSTISGIADAVKNGGKITAADVKKLEQSTKALESFNGLIKGVGIIIGSVIALAVTIKLVGAGPILGAAAITMAIVTAYGALALVITALTTEIEAGAKGLSSLMDLTKSLGILILGTVLIGVLASAVELPIMQGFMAISGVLLGYALIFSIASLIVQNEKQMENSVKGILQMGAAAMGLLLGTTLIGFIAVAAWPAILAGFAAISAVLLGYSLLYEVVDLTSKGSAAASKNMLLVATTAIASAVIILSSLLVGHLILTDNNSVKILTGLAAVAAVTIGIGALTKVIQKVANSRGMKTATTNMLLISGVMAAAELLILGAIGVAAVLKNSSVNIGEVLLVLATCGAIVAGFGALAGVAGKFSKQIEKGIPAIALVEALALGAEALLLGIIGISTLKNENDISWGEVFITLGAMASVVTAFGALAAAAGAVTGLIMAGIPALALVEAVAAGAVLVLGAIVHLVAKKKEAEIEDWGDIFVSIGAMATIVTAFGALATAASLATPFLLAGSGGLAAVSGAAMVSASMVSSLVVMKKSVDELGETGWKDLETAVGKMGRLLFADIDSIKELTLEAEKNTVKILIGAAAVKQISNVVDDMARAMKDIVKSSALVKDIDVDDAIKPAAILNGVVNALIDNVGIGFGIKVTKVRNNMKTIRELVKCTADITSLLATIAAAVSPSGKNLRLLSFNKETGKTEYGKEFDITIVANTIGDSISDFTRILTAKITQVSKKQTNSTRRSLEVIVKMIDPVNSFVEMLGAYDSGEVGQLRRITFDEKGNPVLGKEINVKNVANTIAGSISEFCATLFSDANISIWDKIGSNNSTSKGVTKSMGVFAKIIDPIISFTNLLSSFGSEKEGILISYDESGNKHDVDVKKVSNLLSNAITYLIAGLGNAFADSDKLLKSVSKNQKSVVSLLTVMTSSITDIGKVDSTNANATITAYSDLVTRLTTIEVAPNVSDINTTINNILTTLNAAVTGVGAEGEIKTHGGIEGLNKKMTDSFLKVKSTLKDLDKTLDSGNKTRVKNIKEIANAIKEVNDESSKAKENLGTVKDILEAIARITKASTSGELESVVNSLNSISIGGGKSSTSGSAANGNGNTVSISSSVIEQGVRDALLSTLDDARIRTSHNVEEIKNINGRGGTTLNISSESNISLNDMGGN